MRRLLSVVLLALLSCGPDTRSPFEPEPEEVLEEGTALVFDFQDGPVTLSVPAGALTEPTVLTVEPTSEVPAGTSALPGTVFDFGPDGTQFAEPIEITVSYDPADVPEGVPEASLRLFVLADGIWEVLDGSVDTAAKTITGFTDHFSTFGTFSVARFCPGSADPTSFETIADALDAVIPGGTIEVCDGTHVVEGATIDQAVTIRAELNTSPVIETSESDSSICAGCSSTLGLDVVVLIPNAEAVSRNSRWTS